MRIINFAHPLTRNNLEQIQEITKQKVESVISIPSQFDPFQEFVPQVKQLIQSINLNSHDWQTETLLVNLPSLNIISAVFLAELHGRMGYFPAVIRLRAVKDAVPPQFEVAEIINLQSVRDSARLHRSEE